MDGHLLSDLRTAYDHKVAERQGMPLSAWKAAERARFLALVQAEGKQTLLEIGAGAGRDSLFFQQNGLAVTCVDLAPAMVAHCRSQGLDAHVVEFAQLDQHFAAAHFDSIYAINCLLHVPKAALPSVLEKIRALLRPQGLFYWGQYGGVDEEGVWAGDHYEPKRFFARYTDEPFKALARSYFTLETFCQIPQRAQGDYFHAVTLRKS